MPHKTHEEFIERAMSAIQNKTKLFERIKILKIAKQVTIRTYGTTRTKISDEGDLYKRLRKISTRRPKTIQNTPLIIDRIAENSFNIVSYCWA